MTAVCATPIALHVRPGVKQPALRIVPHSGTEPLDRMMRQASPTPAPSGAAEAGSVLRTEPASFRSVVAGELTRLSAPAPDPVKATRGAPVAQHSPGRRRPACDVGQVGLEPTT